LCCATAIPGPTEPIVAPLTQADLTPGVASRIRPRVHHAGREYFVIMRLMSPPPVQLLRRPVGSLAAWRDDINVALDWLFYGIRPARAPRPDMPAPI
jgi:hypothetical protein